MNCASWLAGNGSAFRAVSDVEKRDWQDVGFSFAVVNRWIDFKLSPKRSNGRFSDYLVFSALLTQGFLAQPHPQLLVPEGSFVNEYEGQPREKIGGAELISVSEGIPWKKTWFGKLRPLWIENFLNSGSVDLPALWERLQKSTPPNEESWIAAQALKAGMAEEDPHSDLIPRPTERRKKSPGIQKQTTELNMEPAARPSPQSTVIPGEDGKIGWLQISDFAEKSLIELTKSALRQFTRAGVRGIILDLRNNPGGLVDVSLEVAGLFQGEAPRALSMVPLRAPHENRVLSTHGPAATHLPLVILVDESTVSAAEILAGLLQSTGRAVLVGVPTFGKGSVQAPHDMRKEVGPLHGLDIILRQTTHLYAFANGQSPQLGGLTPDYRHPDPTPFRRRESQYPNAQKNPFAPGIPPIRKNRAAMESCLKERLKIRRQIFGNSYYGDEPDPKLYFSADVLHCLLVTQ